MGGHYANTTRTGNGAHDMIGKIGGVAVFNRVLSDTELQTLAAMIPVDTSVPGPVSLTLDSPSYTQNFDSLGNSGTTVWTDGVTLTGWFTDFNGSTTTTYAVANGSAANPNALLSIGATNATDRALGTQTPNALTPSRLGLSLKNTTDATQTALGISYDAEVWRSIETGDGYTVQYQVFASGNGSLTAASGWTTVSALAFASSAGTAGQYDGNLTANRVAGIAANLTGLIWAEGQELWIRWNDGTSKRQMMGIDNIQVNLLIPVAPTGLTATASAAGTLTLAWTAGDATPTGYSLEHRVAGSGSNAWAALSPAPASSETSYTHSGLSAGVSHEYRLRASNSYGSSGAATASATTWTNLETWRNQSFGSIANTGNAANTADPDGDGLANLLEYALDREPLTPESASPTTAAMDGAGKLQLTFKRARPAAELTYTVQASDDLATWTDLVTNPGTVGENVTVTDNPPESAKRRFLRLRVSVP